MSANEIRRWHTDPPKYEIRNGKRVNVGGRGWSDIGYHKVVHLDGSVSMGRPESQVGAHVANRNARTIGYVYVGGIDANDRKRGKDTRTPAQKRTMERLTREAIERYGLTKVSGHSDYANKACPCFNARAEYAHLLPQRFIPDIDDERDSDNKSKYDEPIVDEAKPGLLRRAWRWLTGGSILGAGGLALTDWQVALVLIGGAIVAILILGGIAFGASLWLFGKERVKDKIAGWLA